MLFSGPQVYLLKGGGCGGSGREFVQVFRKNERFTQEGRKNAECMLAFRVFFVRYTWKNHVKTCPPSCISARFGN